MPWIFEPSHRRKVGQNTSIISGVPELARYKNGMERIVNTDASRATFDLNQRFNKRISKKPKKVPIIILGSLIV